ncbi:MAG: murein biosynthesis integral membrane protein MurJ [Synechocystis sp.]
MSQSGKSSRSLVGIAGIVAIATLISKVFGLVREQIIAAAFGVGTVVNAYAYAYVIPGFLFILLGGINGPFHSALVSVLSKRSKDEAAPLVETVTTLVSLVLLGVTLILVIGAGLFIDVLAPGLEPETRRIAVQQLQIMAPMALLAGLIGIGFGTLNAADQYWLPSISPLLSSITVILGLGVAVWQLGDQLNTPQHWLLGSLLLAGGTTAGAVLQWLAQIVPQAKAGMGKIRLRFEVGLPGVRDVMQVLIPATLSSGMLYINFATNLFFASFIPNAAAAMRYGNFVALTPLGIISNMILVPFLPVFSRLTDPDDWPELKLRIRQGLLLSALTMLPLTAILMGLATPIVQVIYQRGAFNAEAAAAVAPVLAAYGLGMFFYLGRDVLVRVFYALGDGNSPFRVSAFNIFLNALLDFLFYKPFGTVGIVMATVGVNLFSLVVFLGMLDRRLGGLPLFNWGLDIAKLTGIAAIAGVIGWQSSLLWETYWGSGNLVLRLLELSIMSAIIIGLFALGAWGAKVPEVSLLGDHLLKKLKRA